MVVRKTPEELDQIADELMRVLPPGVEFLTPELEQRFADIVGPLSEEDLERLCGAFVVRYMPERAKEILTS